MNVSELLKAGLIKQEEAEKIESFYRNKKEKTSDVKSPNRFLLIFGILGSILAGLGFIIILSNSWDSLSKITRLIIAFIPLVIAQVLCAYTLFRKNESIVWRESVGAFIFFAFGSTILIISQIYNISDGLRDFFVLYALACLPFVYILKSSVASLSYLFIILLYLNASDVFILSSIDNETVYSLLLIAIFPYYYYLYRNKPNDILFKIHNWVIPISLVIFRYSLINSHYYLFIISSLSLFSIFIYIGDSTFFKNNNIRNNSYKLIGYLGMLSLIFPLSSKLFLHEIFTKEFNLSEIVLLPEFYFTILFSSIFIILFIREFIKKKIQNINYLHFLSLASICLILLGLNSNIFIVCSNIIILLYSVINIIDGFRNNKIRTVNFGLVIFLILVLLRFNDSDINILIKGLSLLVLGFMFFGANYLIINKKK